MTKLQILMPVYNEASSIENTLNEINDTLKDKIEFEFIISEDGSSDGTKEILKKLKNIYPMKLISDSGRKYYSKAVIDGIKKADADYLLIKDSDGQCDPKDILNFWDLKDNSDLVNGYRYPRYDFAYRRFISKMFYYMYKILFNVPLRDPSFAYVFMSKKVLFYKAIMWQMIGFLWISILSYIWFDSWVRSLSFSAVVLFVSVFIYILYELAWDKIIKNRK